MNLKLWRQHDPARGTSRLAYTAPDNATVSEENGTIGRCYGAYLKAASMATDVFPSSEEQSAESEQVLAQGARRAIDSCLKPFKERYWNSGAFEIAIAGYRSDVQGLAENGAGGWIGWSYGIGERSQLVVRSSYSDNRLVAPKDESGEYTLVDEIDAGIRYRYGSSRATVMVEGLWTKAKNETEDEYWRGMVGTELMVLRDIWIQIAVGKAFGTELFEDDPVYSAQLRFGFSKTSLFNPG